jgi:hypothetical protein|tara:strand:+ start:74 stop:505 length:432 start_codon:yes stop_codon:yes gene_type:complete
MSIKLGDIKELQEKYGIFWVKYFSYGEYDFHKNKKLKPDKVSCLIPNSWEEHERLMNENWIVDNSSEEKDGEYFLVDDLLEGKFSKTKAIIKNGEIDVESFIKAYASLIKQDDDYKDRTIFIEQIFPSRKVDGKDCIDVWHET